MRAVVVEQTGGPEVLQVRELEPESPPAGQVRVEVAACGVNFIDVYERTGAYPKSLPFVAGSEGAGTVTEVGPEVADVSVGDRVAWAMVEGGGYAEEANLPAARLVPVPDGVDLDVAAAVMLQGMTAHYLCESTFRAGPEHVALVHAAAGGVGSLLTQMLSAKGTRVIATTSTPEKAELARSAGAGDVVLYTETDLVEEVTRLTDGAGVHVVYDGVGATTFDAGLELLRPRGMMVLYGASSGAGTPVRPAAAQPAGLAVPDPPHPGPLHRRPGRARRAGRRRARTGRVRRASTSGSVGVTGSRTPVAPTRTWRAAAPPASCWSSPDDQVAADPSHAAR